MSFYRTHFEHQSVVMVWPWCLRKWESEILLKKFGSGCLGYQSEKNLEPNDLVVSWLLDQLATKSKTVNALEVHVYMLDKIAWQPTDQVAN